MDFRASPWIDWNNRKKGLEMRRWIWRTIVGISGAICLALAVLWPRSYWVGELIDYESATPNAPPIHTSIGLERGLLSVTRADDGDLITFGGAAWRRRGPYWHLTYRHTEQPVWMIRRPS